LQNKKQTAISLPVFKRKYLLKWALFFVDQLLTPNG